LTPYDLIRYIAELKIKVSFTDICEIYRNFKTKDDFFKYNSNELKRIKELDQIISKLDYNVIREIRKNEKE
jgi:hypothetical protein